MNKKELIKYMEVRISKIKNKLKGYTLTEEDKKEFEKAIEVYKEVIKYMEKH